MTYVLLLVLRLGTLGTVSMTVTDLWFGDYPSCIEAAGAAYDAMEGQKSIKVEAALCLPVRQPHNVGPDDLSR